MSKIVSIYDSVAGWLASYGADRWMHLVCGLVIAYVVGLVADDPWWSAALVGVLASVVAGFAKELADSFIKGAGDAADIVFTVMGGAAAFGLLALHQWLG